MIEHYSEINGDDIKNQADLNNRAKNAAFWNITSKLYWFSLFKTYLEENYRKDALLGIGITGIGSGEILKYNLDEAASVAVRENTRVAS